MLIIAKESKQDNNKCLNLTHPHIQYTPSPHTKKQIYSSAAEPHSSPILRPHGKQPHEHTQPTTTGLK